MSTFPKKKGELLSTGLIYNNLLIILFKQNNNI